MNMLDQLLEKKKRGDFPSSPVAKTLPSNTGGTGSIPGQGTKIPHTTQQKRKKKKKREREREKTQIINEREEITTITTTKKP